MENNLKKRRRHSPQRALILDIIKDSKGHMSVPLIFEKARMKMPKISLGTLYLNLGDLESAKEISSILGPNNITLFEVFRESHHHFICEQFSKIENLETPGVHMCVKCIEDKGSAKVNKVYTTIYGICVECKK